jgi:hypothetical protein
MFSKGAFPPQFAGALKVYRYMMVYLHMYVLCICMYVIVLNRTRVFISLYVGMCPKYVCLHVARIYGYYYYIHTHFAHSRQKHAYDEDTHIQTQASS